MSSTGNIDLQNGVFISAEEKAVVLGTAKGQPVRVFCNNENTQAVCELRVATAAADMASGTATLTGIIPDGAFVIGVTAVITEALAGSGVTGANIGDGSDADYWGVLGAITKGTAISSAARTSATAGVVYTSAANIVITPVGGTSTDGTVRVNVYYFTLPSPSA